MTVSLGGRRTHHEAESGRREIIRADHGEEGVTSAYAIAHIQSITMGPPIVEYLERIDSTLAPYQGRFLVHGDPGDVREGSFAGNVVVIEFPDRDAAVSWYESEAYRKILPLRAENSRGWLIIVDGVGPAHRASDILGSRVGAT